MFADLGSFFAASDDVTWVSTATAMYRTEDTGRTWRAVQPAGWSSTGMTTFVDADTAYFSTGGRPAAIYATHDGGSSWTRTSVDAGADVIWPTFSFQTPTSGFATFVDPARDDAPAGTGLLVFATTDGGVTWTGPMPGVQPHLDASMNKLEPANGAFLVHSAGKGSFAFENWFFVSADGGVTWTRYAFPTGKLAPKNVMKGVGEILREANGHLLISLGVQSSGSPIPEAIYESGNDTSTWRLVSEAPPGDMSVQLLSDTTWVLTGPDEIRTTTDAGAHWTSLVPPASLFYEQPSLQFATLRTGWATLECQHVKGHDCGTNPRAIVLFVTTDSGATWTPIGG